MNRKNLTERIQKEYESFKNDIMQLSKEEVYNHSFEIEFYASLTGYMTDTESYLSESQITKLLNFTGDILSEFYNLCMSNDSYLISEEMYDELLDLFDGSYQIYAENDEELN